MSVFMNPEHKTRVIKYYSKEEYRDRLILLMHKYRAMVACVCIVVLALPLAREILEQFMISHVLVQLPLLVLCGVWVGLYVDKKWQLIIPYYKALPLLLIALFTAMFWMLPRALDSSLEHDGYFMAKFLTLPLLLGVPLVLAWRNIGPITKAFVVTNIISMLVVLAWLYIEAPVRLCNYYLIDEQQMLGMCLLYIAGLLALLSPAKLFTGTQSKLKRSHSLDCLNG